MGISTIGQRIAMNNAIEVLKKHGFDAKPFGMYGESQFEVAIGIKGMDRKSFEQSEEKRDVHTSIPERV